MSLFESILYGLVSGVAEFLPVSAGAHQALLRLLFGVSNRSSLQELLIHIGVLASVFVASRETLSRLRLAQNSLSHTRRRRARNQLDGKSYYDLRLVKTAAVPLIIGLFIRITTQSFDGNLLAMMGFMVLNASVLLLVAHGSHGNRDARTMSGLDGIVMGLAGALSVFPGMSRTGMIASYATARGADGESAADWAIILGIPALLFAACFDVAGLFFGGMGALSASMVAGCVLSGLTAFCGGYVGISVLRLILNHAGYSKFAYYSIGTAMFSFILYLIA